MRRTFSLFDTSARNEQNQWRLGTNTCLDLDYSHGNNFIERRLSFNGMTHGTLASQWGSQFFCTYPRKSIMFRFYERQ